MTVGIDQSDCRQSSLRDQPAGDLPSDGCRTMREDITPNPATEHRLSPLPVDYGLVPNERGAALADLDERKARQATFWVEVRTRSE